MNNECSLVYPAIAVIELMKQFGVSQVQPLEKFLRNIRIQTTYLKTETGEPKPNVLTIKGFGRMRDPEVDEKGVQKVEDQKLKWKGEADASPGNAIDLKFLRGPGEMISVKDYFAESRSLDLGVKIQAHNPFRGHRIEVSKILGPPMW